MSPDDEARDLLTLHLVSGVGPRLTSALLEHFGSATAILQASVDDLLDVPYLGPNVAQAIAGAASQGVADAELVRLSQNNVQLLASGTPDYPTMLNGIPDQPHLLFIRGTLRLEDANAVALVGSRHCTSYGKKMTEIGRAHV